MLKKRQSDFLTSQEEIKSSKYSGTFNLRETEKNFLIEGIKEKFIPTSSFKGVEKIVLDSTKVPVDILEKIKEIGGENVIVKNFIVLKINKGESGIPLHLHPNDGEIFFGGEKGAVILINDSEKERKVELSKNTFTAVSIGGQHGIISKGEEIIFFAVIFK